MAAGRREPQLADRGAGGRWKGLRERMKVARRLALATVVAAIILVAIGVLVRATGSGLGCPDWPTCDGGVLPPGGKHPVIEMSHRLAATAVGLMVIAVAVVAWRYYRHMPVILWVAVANVPLVGLQGLLGAVTVKRELPPEIVATHLLTAMLVLSATIVVAVGMYLEEPSVQARLRPLTSAASRRLGQLGLAAIAWLAVVMWVGGYMTESGASSACGGWPACNGSVLPANDDQEIMHMLHRYLAGVLVFFVSAFVVAAWRARHEVRWAVVAGAGLGAIYALQVTVGALNVWYSFPDWLAVSHTVIATLAWATLAATAVLSFYVPVRDQRRRPLAAAGVTA